MHDAAFAAHGIDARYELRELEPDALAAFVAEARDPAWFGFQVTAPYKQAIMELLDAVEPEAAAIGAVNSVERREDGTLAGFNTDAPGFARAVERDLGVGFAGAVVVVAGAGGAARAVVSAAAGGGAAEVIVAARRVEQAARRRWAAPARSRSTIRSSPPCSPAPTWSSTRPPSACSTPAASSTRTPWASGQRRVRPRLRPAGDRARPARARARPQGRQRRRDARGPGRDRLRALDRDREHRERHARARSRR